MEIWVDVEEFTKHYQAGQRLEKNGMLAEAVSEYEQAESLYQGDFLEEDLYEDWTNSLRESLKANYLTVLDRLSRYYFEEKRYATCILLCQKILAEDDCRENTHRRLMHCYFYQGQSHLAVRQYQLCLASLKNELDILPSKDTKDLYLMIRGHNRG
jgi:DNA-binding SARP family transcriptional activator